MSVPKSCWIYPCEADPVASVLALLSSQSRNRARSSFNGLPNTYPCCSIFGGKADQIDLPIYLTCGIRLEEWGDEEIKQMKRIELRLAAVRLPPQSL